MKFKALFAVVLAVALLAGFAAPALAADGWVWVGVTEPVVIEDELFPPLPDGVPGISPAGTVPENYVFETVTVTPSTDASTMPKTGDLSADMTWLYIVAAAAFAGVFVILKKRAQA